MAELHVAATGSDLASGGTTQPLRTVSRAAELAMPGDTVIVHEGEYREWVKPRRGGRGRQRITYRAADGEHVVIKGSERVTGWQAEGAGVWRIEVPTSLFGDFNPFAEPVFGDWLVRPAKGEPARHLGDVYLDGKSFFEVATRGDVDAPPVRRTVVDDWTGVTVDVADPGRTQRVWYAEVGAEATTIWANFGDADPNDALAEINVRRSVFYPERHHLDNITVQGFELAQAACPWAPPTADQPGLIGPNWAKGWIIEDCDIHDAKCTGVSLGKEASTGDNWAAERGDKPGYQYQLEAVFAAGQIGWDMEHIGGHIVRRSTIHDCGQAGVVGHLGCVNSVIEDNEIFNIALKREFYGHEIAGIKLHAAIDAVIRHNFIHDCSLGIWLDWEAQGTRVARNVLFDNSRDLFVEVSHGPYLVDHNVLASPVSIESFSQGGAFVNNLIAGSLRVQPVLARATPYHRPHSTQVAGYAVIYGGDDRYAGNLFFKGRSGYVKQFAEAIIGWGTAVYDGHPASYSQYRSTLDSGTGDVERFLSVPQAVYIHDNVYANGAAPFAGEHHPAVLDGDAGARVVRDGDASVARVSGAFILETTLPEGFADARMGVLTGDDLPPVRFVGVGFENPDGTAVTLDTDLLGRHKTPDRLYPAGPLADLEPGLQRVRLS